jgi:hypothetical protein
MRIGLDLVAGEDVSDVVADLGQFGRSGRGGRLVEFELQLRGGTYTQPSS